MQAGLPLEHGRSIVFFTWTGFDEMDEVSGSGSAELLDDGTLEMEFTYHLGDEAVLKAERAAFFSSLLEYANLRAFPATVEEPRPGCRA